MPSASSLLVPENTLIRGGSSVQAPCNGMDTPHPSLHAATEAGKEQGRHLLL